MRRAKSPVEPSCAGRAFPHFTPFSSGALSGKFCNVVRSVEAKSPVEPSCTSRAFPPFTHSSSEALVESCATWCTPRSDFRRFSTIQSYRDYRLISCDRVLFE
ncbi:hypothetical protein PUN28_017272 [Cardiocondyla obscurior]|uniref:Uncharacterized protein n=1 Tax=Cardiocondyla obscurior TaxID=286306 RepID=A0AAW2EL18_9HYME